MRTLLLTTTTIVTLATVPAFADAFTDKIVADLSSRGFTSIEIKNGPTQVKVEASRGNSDVEIVYDRATGQIISQDMDVADDGEDNKTGASVSHSDDSQDDNHDDDHDDHDDDHDDDHGDDDHDDD